jgi:branched-chain amino acid transport system ATP-binding protein
MLRVDSIQVSYDEVPALRNVSFSVERGSIVAVVGANGAGKSTILKSVSGLLHPREGTIFFEDLEIGQLPPYRIVEMGIAHVPEGRRLFARLSVMKNLILGAFTKKTPDARRRTLERVFELFPVLAERKEQLAGTLSGGEQQMLAIARGLMSQPKLLMLDEPSLGIMPKLVDQLFSTIQRIREEEDLTILLVEQNVREALELSDYGYILQTGQVVQHGTGYDLLETDIIRKAYLGL